MIIRTFLVQMRHAEAGRRAQAASSLARAYLYGDLPQDARAEARSAMLALLDDPSPLVRTALARTCAVSPEAPRHLMIALAGDLSEIAALVLARSPVLVDADLVDCAAIGDEAARFAIACRPHLSAAVAAALAEIGEAASLAALAGNRGAEITAGTLLRMVARHGADAGVREALLARDDIGPEVRQAIAGALARSLRQFVVGRGWLSADRGARAAREACDSATLGLAREAERADLAGFAVHLRETGQLTPSLILRAILSGRMAFAEAALADLAELAPSRAAGLMHGGRSAFATLYRRAGMPASLEPAFAAAMSGWSEAADGAHEDGAPRLSRRMIERALTACETMPFAEAHAVLALLRRFDAEAARAEAREEAEALEQETRVAAVLESLPDLILDQYRTGRGALARAA